MEDPELDVLIESLETRFDLTVADFEGVLRALKVLLPQKRPSGITAQKLGSTDGAILVASSAYPGWYIDLHGHATTRQGRWKCTLRESESRDNDAAIGLAQSVKPSQAILAAVLRLSMILDTQT